MKNEQEFDKLIERYENITLKEIKRVKDKEKLTGFGKYRTCTLCTVIMNLYIASVSCKNCAYVYITGKMCNEGINFTTYNAIFQSEPGIELLKAYRKRAKHMRELLKAYAAKELSK